METPLSSYSGSYQRLLDVYRQPQSIKREARRGALPARWGRLMRAAVLLVVAILLHGCERGEVTRRRGETASVGDPCEAQYPTPSVEEGAAPANRRRLRGKVLPLRREMCVDGSRDTLVDIPALVPLRGDAIAVLQLKDDAVRYFGAHGNPLGTMGRKGDGPGEFSDPIHAGAAGDSVWIYDDMQGRITIVAPDRSVVRVRGVPHLRVPGATSPEPLWPEAVLSDGSLLGTVVAPTRVDRQGAGPPNRLLVRATSPPGLQAVGPFHVLAEIPPRDEAFISLPHGGSVGARPPFPNDPLVAVAPDGSHVAIASASLDGPDLGTIRVVMITAGGDTLYDRRISFEKIPIPSGVVSDALARYQKNAARVKDPLTARALREATRAPPIYPPIVDGVVSDDGRLWMRGTLKDRGYRVLGPHGADVGWVRVPVYGKILAAEGDHIWTGEYDSLGVESIARYRVTFPER